MNKFQSLINHQASPWSCSSPALAEDSFRAWRRSTGCWGSKTSPAQGSSRWGRQCRHTGLTGLGSPGRGQTRPHSRRWRAGRQVARPSSLSSRIFWRQSLTGKQNIWDKRESFISRIKFVFSWVKIVLRQTIQHSFGTNNAMAQQYIFLIHKLYDHWRILSFRIIWLMVSARHVIIVYDSV